MDVNHRLVHDAAFAMALAILDVVSPLLREEERKDAFDEFFRVCQAGIEAYGIQANRMSERMRPSRN